jgi:hypothetical protein
MKLFEFQILSPIFFCLFSVCIYRHYSSLHDVVTFEHYSSPPFPLSKSSLILTSSTKFTFSSSSMVVSRVCRLGIEKDPLPLVRKTVYLLIVELLDLI